jgi:threonine/homoserine/homoserine lactone efflux protein
MPPIETFMTFLPALTLLDISTGPDMMLTIARGAGNCVLPHINQLK